MNDLLAYHGHIVKSGHGYSKAWGFGGGGPYIYERIPGFAYSYGVKSCGYGSGCGCGEGSASVMEWVDEDE